MRRLSVAAMGALLAAGFVAFAQADRGTQSELTAISGEGAGHVIVMPTAQNKDSFTFAMLLEVNVRDMLPNSTFTVERAMRTSLWRRARRSSRVSASTSCFGSSGTARSCGATA